MAVLIGVGGLLKGERFAVGKAMIIGRAFDADIRLDDLAVSRHHARLTPQKASCLVEDLGSGNGTFINEVLIDIPTPLCEGDTLRIGGNTFSLQSEAARPLTPGLTIDFSSQSQPVLETLDIKATMVGRRLPPTAAPDALLQAHERFRTVLEVSNAVQRQLDMDALLGEIIDRLFQVFPQADCGFILLKSDEDGSLVPRVARRRGRNTPETISTSRSIVDKALAERQGILSADAASDRRFSAAMSVMNLQIRSMMCVPIIAEDEALGVIQLDTRRQDQPFTRDDLDLLLAVANQTAFSIANARMHRQLLQQERTRRDLQLARQVQESFLPGKPPETEEFEFCASYRAALEVGGDFYDFIPLKDNQLALCVGDVAGKGVPAALLMARMMSDVRFHALSAQEPEEVVSRLNNGLAATLSDAFVTLIFGVLDLMHGTLRMVNAAHPPPALRRPAGEVRDLGDTTNFPTGMMTETLFEGQTVALEPGDVLCFFSDGITEAMNEKKDLFGTARLHAALARPAYSAREVMENLLRDVQAFVGNTPQSDDLTVVCVGRRETKKP